MKDKGFIAVLAVAAGIAVIGLVWLIELAKVNPMI